MQAQPTEPAGSGICVAHGYGLKLRVHRGHLIVEDGVGRNRQTRRYHRVTSKLRRLVLIGHTGYVTLEALRWLHDIGAALIHIDSDGTVITASTASGPGHASLRRAQALAATSPVGVEVARELLYAKVAGQASLLPELEAGGGAEAVAARALEAIRDAGELSGLLAAEAEAAAAYWDAWSGVDVPLRGADPGRIPDHWRTFGKRHSLLSNGPRLACNPPNAILNYLYALLEAETSWPATPSDSIRCSGSFTQTSAAAPRWRSTPWKQHVRRSMLTCWRCSLSERSLARTSSKRVKETAASRPAWPHDWPRPFQPGATTWPPSWKGSASSSLRARTRE